MVTTVPSHVVELVETLRRRLQCGGFVAAQRQRPADFSRQRLLTFPRTVLFILQKTAKSLQRHLHEFFDRLAVGGVCPPVTAGAWTHARAKLKHTVFIALNRDCVLPAIYTHAPTESVRRWRGHRLLGLDSAVVRLPDGPEMDQHFTRVHAKNNHGPIGDYLEGRCSVLYDLLNRVGLDARLEPSTTGEVALAMAQLEHAAPGDVCLSDRGFAGYPFLARHRHLGLHFVVRCSRSSFGAAQELFRRNRAGRSVAVKLFATPHDRAELRQLGLPLELVVRFVSVRLPTGALEVLATSLLDEQAYPTALFLPLYHRRWGHETFHLLLKSRLELENFSGQTPEAVRQDFHATVLLCNLESVLTADTTMAWEAQAGAGAPPRQVNRAVSFHAIKHELLPLLYSDLPVAQVVVKLQAWFAGAPVSVRPPRKIPRLPPSFARGYHFQRRVKKTVF
jgi:Transposase DDE domain